MKLAPGKTKKTVPDNADWATFPKEKRMFCAKDSKNSVIHNLFLNC